MADALGEDASRRIAPEAVETIAGAIAEAGGCEVFLAASVNSQGIVTRARVLARGNRGAVPAFIECLDARDVVIHNHPSGNLEPSGPDLQLASIFGHNGHGVFIVDNAVRRVYVVVEPFSERDRHVLDSGNLARTLGPGGRLAQSLAGYEVRPQQAAMLEVVTRAFNDDGIAVIEAPTGVGKTLAYLLPAVEWAVTNRERVVISTRTINLQEQICFKDIPLLQRVFDRPFSAVLVKGRSNYLCRRKLERALSEATLFDDPDSKAELNAVAQWAEKTEDGSLADLPFVPRRELWERVCSEADTCSLPQCPNPACCFVGKARREIAKADILVVNHHMFFSDMAIKREAGDFSAAAVLPAYRRVIFDEAHNIEDAATEYLGMQVTRNGALALLGRLLRMDRGTGERGLVPFLKLKLMRETLTVSPGEAEALVALIDQEIIPVLTVARDQVLQAFSALRDHTASNCKGIGREVKWRLTISALEQDSMRSLHQNAVLPAVEAITELTMACRRLAERLRVIPPGEGESESPVLGELLQLQAYTARLERVAAGLAESTSESLEPNTVRWIEIDGQDATVVRAARCPLEVGHPLAEWVYGNLKTVVMTSATLSVQQKFDYFFHRIGLDLVNVRTIESLLLDTPFDYSEQALLCIPSDGANPDAPEFLDEVSAAVREILDITRGHAFVLFTSFYALDRVHRDLAGSLEQMGATPLRQGQATRTQLLERFRKDPASVLFATDSFWEGVDVAGDALQCVIVARLPFRVPTEPIQEARVEAIEAAGGNSFMEYAVPQAVIRFRQGFGRLIRRRTDRGAVVVLDARILRKRYGRVFLDSLPGIRTIRGPRAKVLDALRQFFAKEESL